MSLLLPLGLFGLLGIIFLIIIYIIKPNYQTKFINSTFVWKLSLKYRKKKLPTNRLRNILLFICQVLVIAIAAMILAKPVHLFETTVNQNEVVAIIDSSASMRTETEGETRYDRAVNKVKDLAVSTFAQEGFMNVILADNEPKFIAQSVDATEAEDLYADLTELVDPNQPSKCSFGESDINVAIALTEDLIQANPNTEIYVFTDQTISYVPEGVKIVDVSETGEWNAAILDAHVEYIDNYYDVIVDVATYGRAALIGINMFVNGANSTDRDDLGASLLFKGEEYQVYCDGQNATRVVFKATNFDTSIESESYFNIENNHFYSFDSINVYLEEEDSFSLDNNFQIYGGLKEVIKVQYSSPTPNIFIDAALMVLRSNYAGLYDIQVTENKGTNPALEGYDYYIFEHYVPQTLPKDGVIILLDPLSTTIPDELGFSVDNVVDYNKVSLPLTAEVDNHPLMENIDADQITVSRIVKLLKYDASAYTVLASVDNNPVIMARNEKASKVFVMNFSIHYSNLGVLLECPLLFKNILNYYTPSAIKSNSAEIYEEITINSRSEKLYVVKDGTNNVYTEFPVKFIASEPGTYKIMQTTYFGEDLTDEIFVRVPLAESNIYEQNDAINSPFREHTSTNLYDDLLFYFALALFILIMLEWFLKNRENA